MLSRTSALEDNGFNEYYTIGDPGEVARCFSGSRVRYQEAGQPKRLYKALEIDLTKRYSNELVLEHELHLEFARRKLFRPGQLRLLGWRCDKRFEGGPGFAEGSIGSGIGLSRASPSTASLRTDHLVPTGRIVFKAYGGYTFDWRGKQEQRYGHLVLYDCSQSGTPQTTVVQLSYAGRPTSITPATSNGAGVYLPLTNRGDMGRTEMFTQTDLTLSHSYKFEK